MSGVPPGLAGWSNFYVITGSSAAALTGLMFVAVTLLDRFGVSAKREGTATFSTPTVAHFVAAFLLSTIASAPWPSAVNAGVVLALVGVAGIAYVARVVYRIITVRFGYEADLEDWIWHAVLPLASYIVVVISAVLVAGAASKFLFALGAAVLLLILIGIHNAWDIITFIAIEQRAENGER